MVIGTAGILAWEQRTQVLLSATTGLCDSGQVTAPFWASVNSSAQMRGLDLRVSLASSC